MSKLITHLNIHWTWRTSPAPFW